MEMTMLPSISLENERIFRTCSRWIGGSPGLRSGRGIAAFTVCDLIHLRVGIGTSWWATLRWMPLISPQEGVMPETGNTISWPVGWLTPRAWWSPEGEGRGTVDEALGELMG
jgi:hypothetical protein